MVVARATEVPDATAPTPAASGMVVARATEVPDAAAGQRAGACPGCASGRGMPGQTAVLTRTWRLIRLSIATMPRSRSGDTASASPNR